jgi:hypothetical protein
MALMSTHATHVIALAIDGKAHDGGTKKCDDG